MAQTPNLGFKKARRGRPPGRRASLGPFRPVLRLRCSPPGMRRPVVWPAGPAGPPGPPAGLGPGRGMKINFVRATPVWQTSGGDTMNGKRNEHKSDLTSRFEGIYPSF